MTGIGRAHSNGHGVSHDSRTHSRIHHRLDGGLHRGAFGLVRFVPRATATSTGTRFGTSFLNSWARCPRQWFNAHYRPCQDETGATYRGLAPRITSQDLLRGSIFHEMLAEWYRSGIRNGEDTGERDVELAIKVGRVAASSRASEYEDAYAEQKLSDEAEILMRRYHDWYGPEAPQCEYPQIRVVCDGLGQPLIEREWEFPLNDRYVFTCRTDAIIMDHGILKSLEHKTSSMPWMRLRTIPTDAQFAGEQWILHQLFPEEPIAGTLVNVIGTKRALGKFERETTSRTQAQLDRWQRNCINILTAIDQACQHFTLDRLNGDSVEVAADHWFPDHGTRTDTCTAFNGCDFLDLCSWAGREENRLGMFKQKEARNE